jgi:serine/threonine protein kinase
MDAVIMKCLQKNPAKRFQSAEQLDMALVKASKARPLSPLEASINRSIMNAERQICTHWRQGVEKVKTFLMRQDWRALPGIQKEPTAILGVAGMVGALAVFLFFGGWRATAINAQTVPVAGQNSVSPVALANGASSEFPSSLPGNSLDPIASHEVDLYGRSKAGEWKISSFDGELPDGNLSSEPAAQPAAPPKTSGTAKRAITITPFHTDKRKAYSDAHGSTQLQMFTSPIQPEILTPIDITLFPDAAINLPLPNIVPEPTIAPTNPLSLPKAGGNESKTPDLYLEVAAFKDETWADQAADKLTQLGFHAVLIHKNLWWAQSYHVEVGPYSNQKDINVARQSLASHGFKAHPVN